MAKVKPFRAYRPIKELVLDIAAPPYDVVNSDEARKLVGDNKYSFLRIDRGEINLPKNIDQYDNVVYEYSRDLLDKMINQGIYIQDDKPCFYIYKEIMNGKSQTGLVICASVEEYMTNKIKKHENIRDDKTIDRIKHIEYCNAHTGPIFIIYRENISVTDIINKWTHNEPLYNFITEDDINHIVWKIDDDRDIQLLIKLFEDVKELYIADGHHRSAAASAVATKNKKENNEEDEINYFLAIAYPDNDVKVLEYNRTVKDLNGYTKEEFFEEVSKRFNIIKSENNIAVYPKKKRSFGMYIDREWYLLELKDNIYVGDSGIDSLDVSIIQNNLLSPILGIEDPTKSDRIDFIGGIRGLDELERRADTDMTVSFSLFPVQVSDIMDIADKGEIMPPKSTWFEPKPRSGIFIHKFR